MSSEPVKRYDCVLSREHGDEPEDYEASMVPGTDWVMAGDYKALEDRIEEQGGLISRQGISAMADLDTIADQAATITRLRELPSERVMELIGQIFFYGDFVAETPAEKELEGLLRGCGYFFETEKALMAKLQPHLDTALKGISG